MSPEVGHLVQSHTASTWQRWDSRYVHWSLPQAPTPLPASLILCLVVARDIEKGQILTLPAIWEKRREDPRWPLEGTPVCDLERKHLRGGPGPSFLSVPQTPGPLRSSQ